MSLIQMIDFKLEVCTFLLRNACYSFLILIPDFHVSVLRKGLHFTEHLSECYLCMRRTGIATPESRVTAGVLQAKTGLVSLGHFASSDGIQQVIVTESIHAVVVSAEWKRMIIIKKYVVTRLKQV